MLPRPQQLAFLIFSLVCLALGGRAFTRLYKLIGAGRPDPDQRLNNLPSRLLSALRLTLTQSRTFRTRTAVSIFHSFIFYGFVFYLLVNFVDAVEGFDPLPPLPPAYVLLADLLSAAVLIGVIALIARRFALPSRRDFTFNDRTILHPAARLGKVTRDSLIVSTFILFHVGSRAIGQAAAVTQHPDPYAPFATLLSHLIDSQNAQHWREFGYWGALGSVLAFLAYFPYSKHVHIFLAPLKYTVARTEATGVLPALALDFAVEEQDLDSETPALGAATLSDLAWPRLLDAYACIQCNRCQDVCPATQTGKSLSPSALEINKRMELNTNGISTTPLLTFALSPEAAWACTTCGACIDICPVGDEPMLDLIDIRRQQVMVAGDFPQQLQSAFRGMERTQNPWGIATEKRMDWTAGLRVPTTDENPTPDVLYWVGCAASYDPASQKTARAFVQLLDHAGVDFAVLGKRECCTGDPARRAGNEYLYRQLADTNVTTLNQVRPKLIVATCPHCLNSVGKEYKQIGGDYQVIHHTQYLEQLAAQGKLPTTASDASITYHDPCYLGRHNGVYDAPRNLLNILSNDVVELPRNRENAFCCGAGGAQFWKEEEPGDERISDNRYREAQQTLASATEEKVLAVGCPFCKSMLDSTPAKDDAPLVVKDIAELLLEAVHKQTPPLATGSLARTQPPESVPEQGQRPDSYQPGAKALREAPATPESAVSAAHSSTPSPPDTTTKPRPKWTPKTSIPTDAVAPHIADTTPDPTTQSRPKWTPKTSAPISAPADAITTAATETGAPTPRAKWAPKQPASPSDPASPVAAETPTRPTLAPETSTPLPAPTPTDATPPPEPTPRKAWKPKTKSTET